MLHQRDQVARMTIAPDATDGFAINRKPLERSFLAGRSERGWHSRRMEARQSFLKRGDIHLGQRTPDGGAAGQA